MLFATILTLPFLGCDEKAPNSLLEKSKSSSNIQSIENEPNFMHSFGLEHNDVIDAIRYDQVTNHSSLHFDMTVTDASNKVYVKREYYDSLKAWIIDYKVSSGESLFTLNQQSSDLDSLYSEANLFISVNGIQCIDSFEGKMEDIMTSSVALGFITQDEKDELQQAIDLFDSQSYFELDSIISNFPLSKYSYTSYPSLFRMTSVHYYSGEYWEDHICFLDPTMGIEKAGNLSFGIRDILDGLFIITMDVMGGVSSGGLGTIVASAIAMTIIEARNQLETDPCVCPVCLYYN